jgi:hypothetical protein
MGCYVTHTGEEENAYRTFVAQRRRKTSLEEGGLNDSVILRRRRRRKEKALKWNGSGLIRLHQNSKLLYSTKFAEFLGYLLEKKSAQLC